MMSKLDTFLLAGRITEDEYKELVALMDDDDEKAVLKWDK